MATRCVGPIWKNHSQYGATYDVRHLHPEIIQHTFPEQPGPPGRPGKPELMFPVRIIYSHHCFSMSLEGAGRYRDEEIYEDSGRKEQRIFDEVRWAYSKALPTLVQKILGKELDCFETRHLNFVAVELELAEPKIYSIFFSAKAWTTGVEIFVESAYPKDDSPIARGSGHKPKSINAILGQAKRR